MFVNVVTPLHNGSGEGLGVIDNPILRERTTQFPIIQASSIKGVLRNAYEEINSACVAVFFGPTPKKGQDHAGAISFGDGQILAFPVRSVKGCFVWITSPLVLWRFYDKISLMGLEAQFPRFKVSLNKIHSSLTQALICPLGKEELCIKVATKDTTKDKNKIFLEEYPINFKTSGEIELIAKEIAEKVYGTGEEDFMKNEFVKKLILVDDDTFRYFVTNATEVVPNIKIGDNGTADSGSLRYTEYLPSETIMYSTLIFEKSRKKDDLSDASIVKKEFIKIKKRISSVQIGGDETTGKGIVKLSLSSDSARTLVDEANQEATSEGENRREEGK